MASLGPSVLFDGQRSQVWQDMVSPQTTEAPGFLLGLSSSSQDRGFQTFPQCWGEMTHVTVEMLQKR